MGSVFESQVLELLQEIRKQNIFNRVILLLGTSDPGQLDTTYIRTHAKIEVVHFKSFPNFPLFNSFNRINLQRAVVKANLDLDKTIFHVRGELWAWHLSDIVDKKFHHNILPDIRGVSIEEIAEFSYFNQIVKYLKIKNYKKAISNLRSYSRITCVSNSCKEFLSSKYHILKDSISITPCLASKKFVYNQPGSLAIRKKLKIKDTDILVVFSNGGNANWQKNEIIINFAEIGLKCLNLSKVKINHKNIFNECVRYRDMPQYLNAADIAVIWRDMSIVNQVASPVKFSEYVCCGLPVIANQAVDMIVEYISSNACGLILKEVSDIKMNNILPLMMKDRYSISKQGISRFGMDAIIDSYLDIYSRILPL